MVLMLFLGGCTKPVGLKRFLEDEKIIEIVENRGSGLDIDIEVDPIPDLRPELTYSIVGGVTDELIEDEGEITVENGDELIITVKNWDDFDEDIVWRLDGDNLITTSGDKKSILTIDVGDPPFDSPRTYLLTVIGDIDGVEYCTFIEIKLSP